MANRLVRVFASEQDRVNCPFYFKVGSCRHGERCGRHHLRPTLSTTLLFYNLYQNPKGQAVALGKDPRTVRDEDIQEEFEEFFIDCFEEFAKFGEIEDMMVCDNLADHMIGNVYVKFFREEDAEECLRSVQHRFYDGRIINGELTNATDFAEARCRQFDEGSCPRGYNCNFAHAKYFSRRLLKKLKQSQPHFGENEVEDVPEPKRDRVDRRGRDRRDDRYSRDSYRRREDFGRRDRGDNRRGYDRSRGFDRDRSRRYDNDRSGRRHRSRSRSSGRDYNRRHHSRSRSHSRQNTRDQAPTDTPQPVH